jgi:hypothetical protein
MVGVGGGCILAVVAIGALLADWLTLRWTILGIVAITMLVMLYVLWTTRSRAHVTHCSRCHRPARDGLFCAYCGMQHATHPPRVLDDVSIEISGGKTSLLVPYGTPLPFTMRDEFSTAADKQDNIAIHLLTGTSRTPVRRTVAMFTSKLALLRPRATPKITIELTIDASGEIALEITEHGTDNKVQASGFLVPVTEPASAQAPPESN